MPEARSSQVRITDNDLRPVVNILTILMLIFTTLSVLARGLSKLITHRHISLDDWVILAAFFFSTGQSAAAIIATYAGIGEHWDSLSVAEQNRLEKGLYVSELLYILTVILSKLSVAIFFDSLVPHTKSKRFAKLYSYFLILWLLAYEFTAAFQCPAPNTWETEHTDVCVDQTVFWMFFDVLCILTDAVIVLWPILKLLRVKAPLSRLALVIGCFASRISVIGAVVTQMVFIVRVDNRDYSYSLWPVILCTQVIQALSMLTASIACLQPFLKNLQSGLIRADDIRRRGQDVYGEQNTTYYRAEHAEDEQNASRIPLPARQRLTGTNSK